MFGDDALDLRGEEREEVSLQRIARHGVFSDADLERNSGVAEVVAHVLDLSARLQELEELYDRGGDGGPGYPPEVR